MTTSGTLWKARLRKLTSFRLLFACAVGAAFGAWALSLFVGPLAKLLFLPLLLVGVVLGVRNDDVVLHCPHCGTRTTPLARTCTACSRPLRP
ncbi:MAG: hypothetical protein M3R09_00915 [Actinomycetota bacterium]|jgi:uncharacterized membrane protein AbrB (regulator of aidB expression)|nr:hypothetical protein [Actinomycetota bacterium]MDQ3529545.1 hypothetical protein [Actinomycetota bacterium]